MLLWIVLALMTGAAALAVLWPLSRSTPATTRAAGDIAIYKDQLAEIDRDQGAGRIPAPEAQAARIEVSRRLLQAASGDTATPDTSFSGTRRRVAAVIILVVVPAVGLGVYARLGSPDLNDQPLEARIDGPANANSLDALVARVEAHLLANPEDGRGWEVLAPIYLKTGRLEQAQQAYANALRILGSTADREANLGEAIVAAAGGVVTVDAKSSFQRALALDPNQSKARYYEGLTREQDGDKAGAVAEWQAILKTTEASSPVAQFLEAEIARVSGAAPMPASASGPGPTAQDVASAAQMAPADRMAMIHGMVDGLAARLKQNGADRDGWLKLVRAYSVLGDKDKAVTAAADARKALSASPDAVRAVDDLVKSLGLEG